MPTSSRSRWDSATTSRGAAWRPRGRTRSGPGRVWSVALMETLLYHRDTSVPSSDTRSRRPMSQHPTTDRDDRFTKLPPQHVRVGIVGAGFGGLGAAIKLLQEGDDDFLVFERAADVGGTWWANTYPGCQCDIPSHLYSFSFAPNPDWTRTYPKQPELRDYLRRTAEQHGVYERVRLNTEVTDARWDADANRWRLTTTDGPYTADVVVAAPGPLSEPSIPEIPGIEDFEGTIFHTATWNHDHDLRGRRVAVVGTGASAIQVVPEIAEVAEHLDVIQRTPPWVVPHRD